MGDAWKQEWVPTHRTTQKHRDHRLPLGANHSADGLSTGLADLKWHHSSGQAPWDVAHWNTEPYHSIQFYPLYIPKNYFSFCFVHIASELPSTPLFHTFFNFDTKLVTHNENFEGKQQAKTRCLYAIQDPDTVGPVPLFKGKQRKPVLACCA